MIRMQVYKVGVDPQKRVPFVLLADSDIERLMPIYIGPFEANAIASQLLGQEFPRPLTHDLLATLIDHLDAPLERVVIDDLSKGTYFARLILATPDGPISIDCRPSDGIALALRTRASIYASDAVILGDSQDDA